MLWTSINIPMPVLLPYLMILLIALDQIVHDQPASGRTTWRTLLKKSVDTGQLFWTAISMLAATAYDAIEAWNRHPGMHDMTASPSQKRPPRRSFSCPMALPLHRRCLPKNSSIMRLASGPFA